MSVLQTYINKLPNYSDPKKIQELQQLTPILNYISQKESLISTDASVVKSISDNINSMIVNITKIQGELDTIFYNESFGYLNKIKINMEAIHTLLKDGKRYNSVETVADKDMSPSKAILSQMSHTMQVKYRVGILLIQAYIIYLKLGVSMILKQNTDFNTTYNYIISNLFSLNDTNVKSFLFNDSSIELSLLSLDSVVNTPFRARLYETLQMPQFQKFCLGVQIPNFQTSIKNIVLKFYNVDIPFDNTISFNDLKSRLYLRVIHSYVMAPYYSQYNKHKKFISIEDAITTPSNTFIPVQYLKEFTNWTKMQSYPNAGSYRLVRQ